MFSNLSKPFFLWGISHALFLSWWYFWGILVESVAYETFQNWRRVRAFLSQLFCLFSIHVWLTLKVFTAEFCSEVTRDVDSVGLEPISALRRFWPHLGLCSICRFLWVVALTSIWPYHGYPLSCLCCELSYITPPSGLFSSQSLLLHVLSTPVRKQRCLGKLNFRDFLHLDVVPH